MDIWFYAGPTAVNQHWEIRPCPDASGMYDCVLENGKPTCLPTAAGFPGVPRAQCQQKCPAAALDGSQAEQAAPLSLLVSALSGACASADGAFSKRFSRPEE